MQHTNTLFVGKVLLQFKELPSTNAYAIEILAKTKPSEGTVISASWQSAGRGQIGSTWESAPGLNLTISIILYPVFLDARKNFQLNKAIALGTRDLVASYLPQKNVRIKWPNDIYVEDRKMGGILIQNSIQKNSLQYSVVGIGLNIHQSFFPPGIEHATSLSLETEQAFDLTRLLGELCSFIEVRYLALKRGDHQRLDADYLKYLYRIHEEARFQRSDGSVFKGKIAGVSETGRLLIDREGFTESFDLKEVRFLFSE